MTTQADYTPEEWDLILQAPALVSLWMIQATHYQPTTVARQLGAALAAISEAVPPEPDTELIQTVVVALRAGQAPPWPTVRPHSLEAARAWTVTGCQQLTALLAQRAPAAEAEAFARWLLGIAQQVGLVSERAGQPDHGADAGPDLQPLGQAFAILAAALDLPVGVVPGLPVAQSS